MGFFSRKAEEAKQYLANLVASGLWTASKAIDDYKADQVIRKANAFKQQEQAGVEISNKAARGHADIIPAKPVSMPVTTTGRPIDIPSPKQRKDVTIYKAPDYPQARIDGPRGSYQINTTRFKDVVHELKTLGKSRPDAKVYFSLWDNRRGEWKKMYVEKGRGRAADNGVPVSDLLSRMKSKVKSGDSKTERQGLLDSWEEDIEGGVAGDDTPDDLELPEVFTSIRVHVMGTR